MRSQRMIKERQRKKRKKGQAENLHKKTNMCTIIAMKFVQEQLISQISVAASVGRSHKTFN